MNDKDKKLQAAIAGVMQYLSEEQLAVVREEPVPPTIPSNWSFYSRQRTMLNRDQMQRRVLKR